MIRSCHKGATSLLYWIGCSNLQEWTYAVDGPRFEPTLRLEESTRTPRRSRSFYDSCRCPSSLPPDWEFPHPFLKVLVRLTTSGGERHSRAATKCSTVPPLGVNGARSHGHGLATWRGQLKKRQDRKEWKKSQDFSPCRELPNRADDRWRNDACVPTGVKLRAPDMESDVTDRCRRVAISSEGVDA